MVWTRAEGGWWTQDVEDGAARRENEHRGGLAKGWCNRGSC